MDLKGNAPKSGMYGATKPQDCVMCWTLLDSLHLKPGKHNLRFEVSTGCGSYDRYCATIDALVLTTDAGFAPQGNHPSLSPWPTWEETMKGISFDFYQKKLWQKRYRGLLALTEEEVNPQTAEEMVQRRHAGNVRQGHANTQGRACEDELQS